RSWLAGSPSPSRRVRYPRTTPTSSAPRWPESCGSTASSCRRSSRTRCVGASTASVRRAPSSIGSAAGWRSWSRSSPGSSLIGRTRTDDRPPARPDNAARLSRAGARRGRGRRVVARAPRAHRRSAVDGPARERDDPAVADDPVVDVRLAIRYFRWIERRFRTRDEALMAYNAGPKRIKQYRGRVKDIPDTYKEYPRRIKREHARFVRLLRGQTDTPDSEVLLARVQR